MEWDLSLMKDPQEIEKQSNTSYWDCLEVYQPVLKMKPGGTAYIIPEDQPPSFRGYSSEIFLQRESIIFLLRRDTKFDFLSTYWLFCTSLITFILDRFKKKQYGFNLKITLAIESRALSLS